MEPLLAKYRVSKEQDIPQLKKIFKTSFDVSNEEVEFFFSQKFSLKNCLIGETDEKIVCALHLMDASFVFKSFNERVYYVYAAATLPEYRKKGLMTRLLEYSFKVTKERGKSYSVLKPENTALYDFYQKLGYKKFFKESIYTIERKEFFDLIKLRNKSFKETNGEHTKKESPEEILKEALLNRGGILFTESHIKYALEYNKLLGGSSYVLDGGFLICNLENKDTLYISELFYLKEETLYSLLLKVYNEFKSVKKYIIKTPCGILKNIFEGKVQYCGMIRSMGGEEVFGDSEKPYLGFTL